MGQMDTVGFGDQRASTAARSRMSPCCYVVFVQPCDAGSAGGPSRRSGRGGVLLQRGHAEIPISPVGPVTATVSPIRLSVPKPDRINRGLIDPNG
jgi:hypothetical protein